MDGHNRAVLTQPATPQDHDPALSQAGGTPAVLIRNKERIARLFDQRVRAAVPAAQQHSEPMTIDTLPGFLTDIALALSCTDGRTFASQNSNIALQHGNERAKLTAYTLSEVIKEYQILREILIEILLAEATPSPAEWATLHRSIDEAMREAASAFVQVHQDVKEQFTATLTHDFRGPLSAARNYIELVRRADERAQREHFAVRAIENLRRLDRMIVDLLDVSRASVGEHLPLQPSECELGSLVSEVLDDLKAREGDRFVLRVDGPVKGFVSGDRLRQAVHNLAENAIKYGRSDSPVTVRVLQDQGRVQISVHNLGDPIPASEHAALFQAYHRAPTAEQSGKKGWGLGLVLVQAIAEAHGGTVAVESTTEAGTTFTLDILQDVRQLSAALEAQER
jgi:signal transduction histidine kinase